MNNKSILIKTFVWTNSLFKCLSTSALDHKICTRMRIRSYKDKSSYVSRTYFHRKNFCSKRIYDLSLKKCIKKSRKMNLCLQKEIKPLERSQALQKDEQSRRVTSKRLIPHPQSFFYTIHGSFLKVKLDKIRSKRRTNKSEKLVNHQQLVFCFCETSTC